MTETAATPTGTPTGTATGTPTGPHLHFAPDVESGFDHGFDLIAIRGRAGRARLAGLAAEDCGQGWDEAKIRVLVDAWQDIPVLCRAVADLTEALRMAADAIPGSKVPPEVAAALAYYDADPRCCGNVPEPREGT